MGSWCSRPVASDGLDPHEFGSAGAGCNEGVTDRRHDVGQVDTESVTDGGDDFGRRFFTAAFQLRQVRSGDTCGAGNIGEGAALLQPDASEDAPEGIA